MMLHPPPRAAFAILLATVICPDHPRIDAADAPMPLPPRLEARCLTVLRDGLTTDDFWPAMHAAEGLTAAGHGAEVRAALLPRLPAEADGQRRCGLARELVRAGDRMQARVMLDELAADDDHAHMHAAESLFKVGEIGDGRLLRAALERSGNSKLEIMAAAALARSGNAQALARLRQRLQDDDLEIARLAAWALGRVGDRGDVAAMQAGAARTSDAVVRCYFEHAAAALGDAAGRTALRHNLAHADPAVRVSAAEFAADVRDPALTDALEQLLDDPVFDVRLRAAHALVALTLPLPPAADE